MFISTSKKTRFIIQKLKKMDQANQTQKDDRIYYSLLKKVGVFGWYQYFLIILCFLVGLQSSACFLINPYLFYEQKFQCSSDIENCNDFVCSLPRKQRAPFQPEFDGKLSLGNQFGDFRCQNHSYIILLNSSIILGSVIGIFAAAFFAECLGRRWTMILALGMGFSGLAITLISAFQWMAIVGVFFYGAGLDIAYSSLFAFITEFYAEQSRHTYYTIIMFSFATGILINPTCFYFIQNWRIVIGFFFLLPIVLTLLGFIFIVQNTPIELISRHSPEEIYAALMRIAKLNGKTDHGLTIQAISQLKDQYDTNQQKKHNKIFTIPDLIRFPSLRENLLPLGFLKFMSMFIYYAPGLLLDQFSMSIYINGVVNAASQLASIPLCFIAITMFPRKQTLYLLFALQAIFSLGMYFADHVLKISDLETVFLLLYRCLCATGAGIIVVLLNQTYPAQVRNLAVFVNISFGRSATLIVPFLVQICNFLKLPFAIMLAISSIIGVVATYLTKQTFGIPPPEMVQQVKIQSHDYKYYKIDGQKQLSPIKDCNAETM